MNSFSFKRTLALCRKESLQIVRDPSSILIAFVLPLTLLFLFGYGVNLDNNRVKMGFVVEDAGPEGWRFASVMRGSPYVDLSGGTRAEMQRALERGDIRAMIVLPEDFSRKIWRGDPSPIQVLTDGAEPNTANFASGYAQALLQTWATQRARDLGQIGTAALSVEPRMWFNPGAISRNYLVPGSISIVMTIIGALLTSLVVAREWERGTMEALLSSPATKAELLVSKIAPYYLLGMVAMAVCFGAATWLMGIPFRGSLWALAAITSLFLGSALGIGLLISTLTRSQFNAAQIALVTAFLPAVMLSGFLFEIASMPKALQVITYIIPARYFVSALQTIFQAGDLWDSLRTDFLCLLLLSCFWLGLTALKTRRRLDG